MLMDDTPFMGPVQSTQDYATALAQYLQPMQTQVASVVPTPLSPFAPPMARPDMLPDDRDLGGGWNPAMGGPAAASSGLFSSLNSWMKDSGMLGSTDMKTNIRTDGWGGMAVGGASALMNAFMGMQQLKLAKQTLAEGKRRFDTQYAAQRQTVNTQLEDRQRARVASNAGAYESVGSYMGRNGIK